MKRSLKFWLPPLGYALVIFILSSIESASLPSLRFALGDKLIHLGEYGLFGFLFARLFVQLDWKHPYLWAALIASFYGVTDEIHQFYVPGRTMEVYDWIADTLGGLLGSQACRLWLKKFNWKSKADLPAGQTRENPNPPAGP